MKFLTDQDVYAKTIQLLRKLGHDVVTTGEIGCSQSPDSDLLRIAHKQRRIFVTRDRDFGGLIFVKGLGTGVLYLRILPSTLNSVHKELETVLRSYSENELKNAFVVIEHGRHRFRRL